MCIKKILIETEPGDCILSAGGATYSPLIEWLYLYGYEDLYVQNIDFEADFQRGPIQYQEADFTEPHFEHNSVDAIECLSVIEHGVPLRGALKQFHRILRPGGVLVISTDYWEEGKDTDDKKTHYGESDQEWEIFSKEGIEELLKIAGNIGFSLPEKRDYSTKEQTIR